MNHDDDVVNDIKWMLEGAESHVTNECCIYKVPMDIRKLNHDAYTPKIVSIGPFHRNSHPHLLNMERRKLIYCKAFLEHTQTSLDSWIRYIEEKELNFRRCYSDTIDLNKKELVKMIFVDSGFIFQLFWCAYYNEWLDNDLSLLKPWLDTHIRLDLLLLENQLPFFILEGLFNLSFPSASGSAYKKVPQLIQFAINYFAPYNIYNLTFHDSSNSSMRHFADLIRTFHLQHPPNRRPQRGNGESVIYIPSATVLLEAGVRFKVNEEHECLLDLKFSGGVLEIPQLNVKEGTEVLFRNMVALEQCHYPHESYITDYVAVLDFLVNTSRDVDILAGKGVLVPWLGDFDSVANLFNGLWKNVIHSDFNADYSLLCRKLNAWRRDPSHKSISILKRDYFNSHWQTVASTGGIILLMLTLVQTVCSVLQVVQQK